MVLRRRNSVVGGKCDLSSALLVSETIQDTARVTMENEYELACDLSNDAFPMTLSDP